MKKATFFLDDITYDSVVIESSNLLKEESIDVDFETSGEFFTEKSTFSLKMTFRAFGEETGLENSFVSVTLNAIFDFHNVSNYKEIPEHFYDNSIAMVYPYIRAFLTSIVFQANLKRKFILPTMNLVGVGDQLKANTSVK